MSPYLLLGFLIAGVLHVYVPKGFYCRYLSTDNKLSVLWAALLGVPLPLCSCGVIPTAIGLKKERASTGAVASFLIATPQTGIDSILATYSVMGIGFAIARPVAALTTGLIGGWLTNRFVPNDNADTNDAATTVFRDKGSRLWRVLKYAYFDMMQDIGFRLFFGLLLAALIGIAVPDEFFLSFGNQPLLQMAVILLIAIPMYICSTGSIPVAAALMLKGLSPGAAMVMLMAGPAVNIASVLVVRKSLGTRFTTIYLATIVVMSVLFGLLVNSIGIGTDIAPVSVHHGSCCSTPTVAWKVLHYGCSILLVIFILWAMIMKFLDRFKKTQVKEGTCVYGVEGMNCNHCKASVEKSVMEVNGVNAAEANVSARTLTVSGTASESAIRKAVESAGFRFTGQASTNANR